MRRLRALWLPASGGAVTALAVPPFDVLPAVFLGLGMLALSLHGATSPRAACARAGVWAAVAGAAGMRWVPEVLDRFTDAGPALGAVAWPALAAFQGLAWAGAAALGWLLRERLGVPFVVAFGAVVLAACSAPALFPWTPAGLLTPRPELVQLAELAGERGVSVLVAVAAALGACAVRGRTVASVAVPAVAALALVGAMDRWGAARMDAVAAGGSGERLRVALVDHDAGARERDDPARRQPLLERLRRLSAGADRAGADLVVWPESAYPVPLDRRLRRISGGTASPVAGGAAAPRLIGATTYAARGTGGSAQFNSATIVEPDGTVQAPADKLRLLWFGERWFARGGELEAGGEARALMAGPARIGVLNCYEDLHAGSGRRLAGEARPQLLVNLVNNAWFRGTSAPELHERLAAIRAVELRTDLVRAVNGGGSGWVDAAGRVRLRRPGAGPGFAMAAPALRPAHAGATFYARFGDLPAWALLALAAVLAALRRRHGRGRNGDRARNAARRAVSRHIAKRDAAAPPVVH